jgi:hypothetical protein
MTPELQALSFTAGSVFTPGAPINEKDLFAGRREQVENIIDAVSQRGYHAILYGERESARPRCPTCFRPFSAAARPP